jgi:hypothetical protein
MATRGNTTTGDAENRGFGFPEYVADHKPGFDHGGPEREIDAGDNSHRFRRSEKRDIPQESLASRIGKLKKKKE